MNYTVDGQFYTLRPLDHVTFCAIGFLAGSWDGIGFGGIVIKVQSRVLKINAAKEYFTERNEYTHHYIGARQHTLKHGHNNIITVVYWDDDDERECEVHSIQKPQLQIASVRPFTPESAPEILTHDSALLRAKAIAKLKIGYNEGNLSSHNRK